MRFFLGRKKFQAYIDTACNFLWDAMSAKITGKVQIPTLPSWAIQESPRFLLSTERRSGHHSSHVRLLSQGPLFSTMGMLFEPRLEFCNSNALVGPCFLMLGTERWWCWILILLQIGLHLPNGVKWCQVHNFVLQVMDIICNMSIAPMDYCSTTAVTTNTIV